MILYRIQNKETKDGMWYNSDGTYNGIIKELSDGLSADAPMPEDQYRNKNNKQWISSVPLLNYLFEWFSMKDIIELKERGYGLYEIKCSDYRKISKTEYIFRREDIIYEEELDIDILKEKRVVYYEK